MAIVRLNGGLGNQMFQYAFGRSVAHNNRESLYFLFNSDKGAISREYKLDTFGLKENYHDSIRKKVERKVLGTKTVTEKGVNYNPKFLHIKNALFIGYWQSEKYFKNIGSIIRNQFTFPDKSPKIKPESNSVSVHIRRTDYVSNPVHFQLNRRYYLESIRRIRLKIKEPNFYIFSDDIHWAKNNLNLESKTVYVSELGFQDYQEMQIMSRCNHNIIANSSFSWWGAWLNSNPKKIVVAPKMWFSEIFVNLEDRLPKNWISI